MSCAGDSGGPYFLGDFDTAMVIGIVSYGPFNQTCDGNEAQYNRDISTRVSYFYKYISNIVTDLPNRKCGELNLGTGVSTCDCGNQVVGEYVFL